MNMHSKPVKIGLFFLGLIAVCGLVLLFKGNDAVAMAKEKRDGIVTADQGVLRFCRRPPAEGKREGRRPGEEGGCAHGDGPNGYGPGY